MAPRPLNAKQVGLKHGFRSGLEERLAAQLGAAGLPVVFEEHTIHYVKPARVHKYTPDFFLVNGIIIESKGRFDTADRQKHLMVKEQHPDLDVRFVFSRSASTISKQSKTRYADWCTRFGFLFADKVIPSEWLLEPTNHDSIAALKAAGVKPRL